MYLQKSVKYIHKYKTKILKIELEINFETKKLNNSRSIIFLALFETVYFQVYIGNQRNSELLGCPHEYNYSAMVMLLSE